MSPAPAHLVVNPSPVVEVQLSKGRGLRVAAVGTRWQVSVQRHRQGSKRQGAWFDGDAVTLSMAVKQACGEEFSAKEQADVCRYLADEFWRLAAAKAEPEPDAE